MSSNPFEEIERLIDQMGGEFGQMPFGSAGELRVDVEDRGEEYVVTADLPGYDREDLVVELSEGRLHLGAERETSAESDRTDADGRYLRRERRRSSVSRSVRIPEPVDVDAVEASYSAGVLTVSLPKPDRDDATTIDIE
jgi:HSP20 family protein